MGKYTDEEVALLKNQYIKLKNKNLEEGSVYRKVSNQLRRKGYDRTPESVRKKVRRLGLPTLKENNGIRRAIVLPDMQVPYHDEKAVSVVEDFMSDHNWDFYINIGDFLDLDQISHYNDRKPRILEGKRLEQDFELGDQILQRHRDIVGDNCEMYYLEGNHEDRINRYLDANPIHEGSMEIPNRLNLDEKNIHWMKFWDKEEIVEIGEATFIHGRYCNKYHAKKHVQRYMKNVFTGHTHDIDCFSMESEGSDGTYVGQSLGCLCEYEQQYKRGEPDSWQQGFGIFYFFPDGTFTYYVPRIFDYRFVAPNGEVYSYK